MWLFDLLNPDNYLAFSFKNNLGCDFVPLFSHSIYLFPHFSFFRKQWQKAETCPHSLCFFRQAIAYFVINKSTSGLQNSSDTQSWWFIRTTHWKQSIFVKKGKVNNMFLGFSCCLVNMVCHSISLVVNLCIAVCYLQGESQPHK